jgi:hypothetical protein
VEAGAGAAASADRPFFRAAGSAWDILGLSGFLLGVGALGLLWRSWMANETLCETIETLDGKLKQQKTTFETSNLSRKTEIAKLEEACRKLLMTSDKLQGDLNSHRTVIPQLRRDVESLKYYCNSVEARLKPLESSTPGAGVAWKSSLLAADSMTAPSSGASIDSEGMAPPDVANIDDCLAALNRGDKPLLRSKARAELNITSESEDSLQRGSSGLSTRLREVHGGGSYLLIERDARHWLLPTVQTLSTFTVNQPQKGIFDYERESVTVPELARAAELELVEGTWEVVRKGVVIVPA